MLHDVCNEYNLDQVLDKPTRKNFILDLVFTEIPKQFGEYVVSSMDPVSDHNLVSFYVSCLHLVVQDSDGLEDIIGSEFSSYDLCQADPLVLGDSFDTIDWNQVWLMTLRLVMRYLWKPFWALVRLLVYF